MMRLLGLLWLFFRCRGGPWITRWLLSIERMASVTVFGVRSLTMSVPDVLLRSLGCTRPSRPSTVSVVMSPLDNPDEAIYRFKFWRAVDVICYTNCEYGRRRRPICRSSERDSSSVLVVFEVRNRIVIRQASNARIGVQLGFLMDALKR